MVKVVTALDQARRVAQLPFQVAVLGVRFAQLENFHSLVLGAVLIAPQGNFPPRVVVLPAAPVLLPHFLVCLVKLNASSVRPTRSGRHPHLQALKVAVSFAEPGKHLLRVLEAVSCVNLASTLLQVHQIAYLAQWVHLPVKLDSLSALLVRPNRMHPKLGPRHVWLVQQAVSKGIRVVRCAYLVR